MQTSDKWYAAQVIYPGDRVIVMAILAYGTAAEAKAARDGLAAASPREALVWPPPEGTDDRALRRNERAYQTIEAEVLRRWPTLCACGRLAPCCRGIMCGPRAASSES